MGTLFGTDGVRGIANVAPMDSETLLRLGRAAAHLFRRSAGRHRILIGKDTRLSGYLIETALASGIVSMGVDVLLVGPLPTPGVAYMTRSMRADAGVMISASHNPFEDNGIKFFGPDGFKLPDEAEREIERLMEPGYLEELKASPALVGKAFRIDDAVGRYTVAVKSVLDRECKFDGMKVVLDTAHGAAYRVGPLVFSELGADLITIGDDPDGKNINERVGSTHPETISQLVRGHGAEMGIAFDGDADRVIFCDARGNLFDGDSTLCLLALDFKRRGLLRGGGVVGTVMSNFGLEAKLRSEGLAFYRADVGDRYVLNEMLQRGANLGGEQSGHVIALDHNTTGDGLITALLVMSLLVREGKTLAEFRDIFERYPQKLVNITVREKRPLSSLPRLQKTLGAVQRELQNRGRVLLRYSGTEPVLRIMVECVDDAQCARVVEDLAEVAGEELMR